MGRREVGAIFAYPYLWDREAERIGYPKDRTTCLAVQRPVTTKDGTALVHLFLLGITDRPRPEQDAVEIPEMEKRRGGLDLSRRACVVISEYNYDVLPLSWWYDSKSQDYGNFSPAFTAEVSRKFLLKMSERRARRSDRTR